MDVLGIVVAAGWDHEIVTAGARMDWSGLGNVDACALHETAVGVRFGGLGDNQPFYVFVHFCVQFNVQPLKD